MYGKGTKISSSSLILSFLSYKLCRKLDADTHSMLVNYKTKLYRHKIFYHLYFSFSSSYFYFRVYLLDEKFSTSMSIVPTRCASWLYNLIPNLSLQMQDKRKNKPAKTWNWRQIFTFPISPLWIVDAGGNAYPWGDIGNKLKIIGNKFKIIEVF